MFYVCCFISYIVVDVACLMVLLSLLLWASGCCSCSSCWCWSCCLFLACSLVGLCSCVALAAAMDGHAFCCCRWRTVVSVADLFACRSVLVVLLLLLILLVFFHGLLSAPLWIIGLSVAGFAVALGLLLTNSFFVCCLGCPFGISSFVLVFWCGAVCWIGTRSLSPTSKPTKNITNCPRSAWFAQRRFMLHWHPYQGNRAKLPPNMPTQIVSKFLKLLIPDLDLSGLPIILISLAALALEAQGNLSLLKTNPYNVDLLCSVLSCPCRVLSLLAACFQRSTRK